MNRQSAKTQDPAMPGPAVDPLTGRMNYPMVPMVPVVRQVLGKPRDFPSETSVMRRWNTVAGSWVPWFEAVILLNLIILLMATA